MTISAWKWKLFSEFSLVICETAISQIVFFRNRNFRNPFYNPVSVSTHGLYELLEEGNTYEELIQNLKSNPDDNRKDYYNLQFAFGKVDISIL